MSLNRFVDVHYYKGEHGLEGKKFLADATAETGYAATYKKGLRYVNETFYKELQCCVYDEKVEPCVGGLIIACFHYVVPFSKDDFDHNRYNIFQKMPFDLHATLKDVRIKTQPHWDVDEKGWWE